jgi:hypothetical protein
MNDQENRRNIARGLLGGYATGTLSEDERRLLFEVAMEDQEIFDELAREQALKEMLETPGVRDRLTAALEPTLEAPRVRRWVKPLMFGLATLFVVGISLTAVLLSRNGDRTQIAQLDQPLTPPAAPIQTAPSAQAPLRDEPGRAEKPKSAPDKPAPPPATSVPQGSSIAIANGTITAAPPPPPAVPEERKAETADARVKDTRAGFMPLATSPPAPAARASAPRFAFDYAVDGQDLVFKFYANGYFSLHIAPGGLTIVDSRVTAGQTRREHITQNGTEATVTFSAVPQAPPGGVSIERGKDDLKGTVEDPDRTRIDFLLKFFWY